MKKIWELRTMSATLCGAVLPYKSTSILSELSTVSLRQDMTYGSSHMKKQCPVFNGEHGIKALFYVKERPVP
jgi:hypothetical protein